MDSVSERKVESGWTASSRCDWYATFSPWAVASLKTWTVFWMVRAPWTASIRAIASFACLSSASDCARNFFASGRPVKKGGGTAGRWADRGGRAAPRRAGVGARGADFAARAAPNAPSMMACAEAVPWLSNKGLKTRATKDRTGSASLRGAKNAKIRSLLSGDELLELVLRFHDGIAEVLVEAVRLGADCVRTEHQAGITPL